jgi:curved DNA-binding protein CbpA
MNADLCSARFRDVLGVATTATRDEIKQAYRRLVMENHPDRFAADRKDLQELRVIALNEAYSSLMSEEPAEKKKPEPPRPPRASKAEKAVGPHKDPAYAYYKQGFLHFSLAVHGIAEMNQKLAEQKLTGFKPYRVTQDFTNGLALLDAAQGYFSRVVDDFAPCVWEADARTKLKRIERFTGLYRRILANLRA